MDELLDWQQTQALAQEADRAAYMARQGRTLDTWTWHDLAGVQPPEVAAPPPERTTCCRSCGAPIRWTVTATGRRTPVDPDGQPHWATCPHADQHRRAL